MLASLRSDARCSVEASEGAFFSGVADAVCISPALAVLLATILLVRKYTNGISIGKRNSA